MGIYHWLRIQSLKLSLDAKNSKRLQVWEKVVNFLEPIFGRLRSFKFWFYYRLHPKHRYNIIKTGLKPGYYEHDQRLLAAIKTITREYIQEEFNGNTNAMEATESEYNIIIIEAYKFWEYVDPVIEKELSDLSKQMGELRKANPQIQFFNFGSPPTEPYTLKDKDILKKYKELSYWYRIFSENSAYLDDYYCGIIVKYRSGLWV